MLGDSYDLVSQVPIYTLHMTTFPEAESFLPQRWADQNKATPDSTPTKVHVQVVILISDLMFLRSGHVHFSKDLLSRVNNIYQPGQYAASFY